MRKIWRWSSGIAITFAALVFVNNTNQLTKATPAKLTILAHRGIAQEFDRTGLGNAERDTQVTSK